LKELEKLNDAYKDCQRDFLEGQNIHHLRELVQATSGMWFLVKDKIQYLSPERQKAYDKLKEIEDYVTGRKSWKDAKPSEVLDFANLLRSFCEENGLTKFEFVKDDDLNKMKKGMFKS
jgi:hypothetical protein